MSKPKRPLPTSAELAILRVLWSKGPSTVREVYAELRESKTVGYTTILKLMQIMAEKGLVTRDEEQKTHVYHSTVPKESTQRQLVDDLLHRAFGGSAMQMVVQALSTKTATPKEIAEIRRLLDDLKEKSK